MSVVIVLAGPNGSGKSTLLSNLKNIEDIENFVSPDLIALEEEFLKIPDINERTVAAMKFAEKLRYKIIETGKDLAFESVFSHESKLDFLNYAKQKGYLISSIFVTTKDPNINIERVAKRVNSGGHDVPIDKIINRYYRSLNLLPKLIIASDKADVYDNSYDAPVIIFHKNNDFLALLNKELRESWVEDYLIKPLKKMSVIDDNCHDLTVEDTTIYLMRRDLHELYCDVIPEIDEIDNETAFKIFELTIENDRPIDIDELWNIINEQFDNEY